MKKITTKILLLCFLVLFSLIPLYSQEVESEPEMNASEQELQFVFPAEENEVIQDSPSTTWLFIRMILVLAVVVLCIYAVFYFVKKTTNTSNDSDLFIKKVASINLSPGKSVQVVTIKNHCYILGVSDSSVQLISELDDKDLIDAMNFNYEKESPEKKLDFASILSTVIGAKKKSFEETLSDSVINMKNQSDRLKNSSMSENKDE